MLMSKRLEKSNMMIMKSDVVKSLFCTFVIAMYILESFLTLKICSIKKWT